MKADCSYQGGWNSLKRFQLWKFYCKNFVISIFLVHFMVLYISVNSYLFSPMPQATGLAHSPAPTSVITEGRECISCHRAEHCHFPPQKTLQDLLAHQANVNLRGIFSQCCCHFFLHHHCCLICLRNRIVAQQVAGCKPQKKPCSWQSPGSVSCSSRIIHFWLPDRSQQEFSTTNLHLS